MAALQDLFVIHDTGAHSHSMGFQYNGKLRAPELLVRVQEGAGIGAGAPSAPFPIVDLVRAREVKDDLFSNTRMPPDLAQGVPKSYPYFGKAEGAAQGKLSRGAALAAAGVLVCACVVVGARALAARK